MTDKIVTLSYGTFSCSLQGFDDKFDLLKPIANYFRDLLVNAPKDGKRQPAPDADDMARLIGDIIAHPVEGYEAQGMIILKPVAEPENLAMTEPAEADEGLPEVVNGNGPTLEETLAAISDILPSGEQAEIIQDAGVELADEGNIFRGEDPDGDMAVDDDPAPEGDTQKSTIGDEGPVFEKDKPVGDKNTDLEVTRSGADGAKSKPQEDAPQDAPKPVAPASRMARVIKMKRADFDAAINSGVIEEDLDDPVAAAPPKGTETQTQGLSPESEADLQRQLAKAEGNSAVRDVGVKPTKPKVSGRRKGVDRLQSSERRSDLERIFEEADSQMEKPEVSGRRSALQHLRAAVSATRAEKLVGHELDRNIDEAPYRTDLAEAVEAPADVSGKNWARRKKTSVLPTLKLAIDQRVDTDKI